MSERKKVIHVKDLVIKADNVIVEPQRNLDRVDPFFGDRKRREMADEESSPKPHEDEDTSPNEGGGFSWI